MYAVAEQIMKTIIAGRSRYNFILCTTTIQEYCRLLVDESTKRNIVRLNKGELVMIHLALENILGKQRVDTI